LWDGIADGIIDAVVSDHHAEDVERKDIEFEYAAQGMIQLQTAWSLLNMNTPATVSQDIVIRALTHGPRKVLNQPPVSIAEGSPAELTLFRSDEEWELTDKNNLSKSKNSPAMNSTLRGRVIATINKDQLFRHV
jgi:dihydroorotase